MILSVELNSLRRGEEREKNFEIKILLSLEKLEIHYNLSFHLQLQWKKIGEKERINHII